MAITLIACQGEHLLAEIRFDEPDGHNMHMAPISDCQATRECLPKAYGHSL